MQENPEITVKNKKRLTLSVILLSATLTVMAGSLLSPVINMVREGLLVDRASVGIIITTHSLFIALFSPVMGILIDKIGTRKPFIFGLVLYGLAGGSGLLINSYWVLIASRAIFGIAVAAVLNSITVTILNLYAGPERHKVMGWRASANSLGGMLFPLIGGALGSLSWHLPFAVYLVGLPLGFLALITVPETHPEKHEDTGEEGPLSQVFKDNPIIFAVYGFIFLTMILLYVRVIFLPQILETIDISNPFFISLFLTAGGISGALTSLVYGRIKSRLSYKQVVLIALFLWILGLTSISQVSSGWMIAVSVAIVGIGQGMVQPAIPAWIGEIVPVAFRGRVTSYLSTLGYVGQFSSPIIFGLVVTLFGLHGVFLVAGGVCTVVFLLFLIFMS